MTPRTKYILQDALNIFKALTSDKQQESIQSVKDNLNNHYNALKTIGIGLEEDKVKAGEIFLRIQRK